VQGARGTMFWLLSKSEADAYKRSAYIAEEVEAMIPYLLTPHPDVFNSPNQVWVTSSTGLGGIDFIVRVNPDDEDEALVVIANDSGQNVASVCIHFPDSWQIDSVESVVADRSWSYILSDNRVTIELGAWMARAFILTKDS